MKPEPILRIPPFPGARVTDLCTPGKTQPLTAAEVEKLIATMARLRVGGTFWAAQPPLPGAPYVLICAQDKRLVGELLRNHAPQPRVCWDSGNGRGRRAADDNVTYVSGPCDPWHLLGGASRVVVNSDDELALLAAIAGVSLTCVGPGRFAALDGDPSPAALAHAFIEQLVEGWSFADPFSTEPMGISDALDHCGFWRRLIDNNRDIVAAVGIAWWKRPTVKPLLWSGTRLPFSTRPSGVSSRQRVAVWRSRCSPRLLAALEYRGIALVELEDGFIRSAGLGADCVPPLSIVVDRSGIHFDPTGPSELELLLENEVFTPDMLDRARQLREILVKTGVSKYGVVGTAVPEPRISEQRYILVPGQVTDDRSVICGGGAVRTNLDLLERVRLDAPDAYILYKPHPDVEAGHRVGALPDALCLTFADQIVRNVPISALITMADEVHVNTSLAGFEAIVRNKAVTTHGVPFYAGWGLTRDLGPVPQRRTARRTLDELICAVLLLYPRYLDPETGLPCPPETLIAHLSTRNGQREQGLVVQLRRFQGRCNRILNRIRRGVR